ncbi:hypothetical protein S83_033078 [Arachis hypogaea]
MDAKTCLGCETNSIYFTDDRWEEMTLGSVWLQKHRHKGMDALEHVLCLFGVSIASPHPDPPPLPPRLPIFPDPRVATIVSPTSSKSECCHCVSSSIQICAPPLVSSFVQIHRRRYVSFFIQICGCRLSSLSMMPTAASLSSSSSLPLLPLPLPWFFSF